MAEVRDKRRAVMNIRRPSISCWPGGCWVVCVSLCPHGATALAGKTRQWPAHVQQNAGTLLTRRGTVSF